MINQIKREVNFINNAQKSIAKYGDVIETKLIALFFILCTPVFVLTNSQAMYATQTFFITDYSVIGSIASFVNVLRVLSLICVIGLVVIAIIKKIGLYELPEEIERIVNIAVYGVVIATAVFGLFTMLVTDLSDGLGYHMTIAYYILLAIGIYGLLEKLNIFKLEFNFDVFGKFAVIALLITVLSTLAFTIGGSGVGASGTLQTSFLAFIGEELFVTLTIFPMAILTFSIAIYNLFNKVDDKIKAIVVIANFVVLFANLIYLSVSYSDAAELTMYGINVNLGFTMLGWLYFLLNLAMAVYSVVLLVKMNEEAK